MRAGTCERPCKKMTILEAWAHVRLRVLDGCIRARWRGSKRRTYLRRYEWVRFKTKVDKVYDKVLYLETGRSDIAFLILGDPHDADENFRNYRIGKTYRFRVQITGIDLGVPNPKKPYSWYIIAAFD